MGVVRTAVILGGEEVNDVGSSMKLGAWTCVHHWGGAVQEVWHVRRQSWGGELEPGDGDPCSGEVS